MIELNQVQIQIIPDFSPPQQDREFVDITDDVQVKGALAHYEARNNYNLKKIKVAIAVYLLMCGTGIFLVCYGASQDDNTMSYVGWGILGGAILSLCCYSCHDRKRRRVYKAMVGLQELNKKGNFYVWIKAAYFQQHKHLSALAIGEAYSRWKRTTQASCKCCPCLK